MPCWIDTNHPDPEWVVPFYSGLFGWELENVMPPESDGDYFIGRLRGGDVAALGGQPKGSGPRTATWNTYIWVDSADDTASKVADAGGEVVAEPFDVMDAGRMAVLTDPEGAAFCVWQANRHRGARVVNEHGSLNFNNLNTRDPERAGAFYGSVFGWEPHLDTEGGFWRLPGYGDYLEERDPGAPPADGRDGRPDGLRGRGRGSDSDRQRGARGPRRTGASRSRSTTRTRSPRVRTSWADACSAGRSTPRG